MAPTPQPQRANVTDMPGDLRDFDASYEGFRSLTVVCEVLNIFVLVSTIWILVCIVVYGIKCKKWLESQGRLMYLALFVCTLLTLPDAITVLVVFHLHDVQGADGYCEVLMDVTVATATLSLLATYVFLWLRLRVIYNYKQMKVIYSGWIRYCSCGLVILLCTSIIGLAVLDIIPVSTTDSEIGCVYSSHTNATDASRLLTWSTIRGLELGITTVVQIAFLSLFIYPMVQTRRSVRKLHQKYRAKHDRILSVVKRYTICAGIAVASDIAAEIWIQTLPDGYPGVVRATISGTDIFIDVVCMVATFADYRVILSVLCRAKDNLNRDDSISNTLARKASVSTSEKKKISVRNSL